MGQYRSYRNSYLDKEIADIERELLAFKTTQAYGAIQIKSKASPLGNVSSTSVSGMGYFVAGLVSFVGVNKDKLARGALTWVPISEPSSWYMCEASGDKDDNTMSWYVVIRSGSAFTVTFRAYMNMDGRLIYDSII